MSEDLENFIPKKEENTEIKKELSSGNGKTIFLTILLFVVIGFAIFSFIFVYNNYLKDNSSNIIEDVGENLQKETTNNITNTETKSDIFKNLEECKISENEIEIEMINYFFMTAYIKTTNNYSIKGKAEDGKCLFDIETIDHQIIFDKELIKNYIDDPKNKNAVYKDYLTYKSLKGELPEINDLEEEEAIAKFEELLKNIDSEISFAKEQLKQEVEDYYSKLSTETLDSISQIQEQQREVIRGTIQTCIFNSGNEARKFVEDTINNKIISSEINIKYVDNKAVSVSTYKGGECTSISS